MTVETSPEASAAATSFGAVQQIDAGLLNVGYVDLGPADGPAVVLLHGWPYDIHSYVDVGPVADRGGLPRDRPVPARLRDDALPLGRDVRNGEQAALALDAIAFMDALEIEKRDRRRLRLGSANR